MLHDPQNFIWDDADATSPTSTRLSFSSTVYNDLGQVKYTVTESDARTDFYYDLAGRQIAELGPVVPGTTNVRPLTESIYSDIGQLAETHTNIAITAGATDHPDIYGESFSPALRNDTNLQATYYEYDVAGRQMAVISPLVNDPSDQSASPAKTHLRSETVYDGFGRRSASIEGIKQSDPFDPATIDRSGQRVTNYEYDDAGPSRQSIFPRSNRRTSNICQHIIRRVPPNMMVRPRYEYRYDAYGNRTAIIENAYVTQFGNIVYLSKNEGVDQVVQSPAELWNLTATVFTFDRTAGSLRGNFQKAWPYLTVSPNQCIMVRSSCPKSLCKNRAERYRRPAPVLRRFRGQCHCVLVRQQQYGRRSPRGKRVLQAQRLSKQSCESC